MNFFSKVFKFMLIEFLYKHQFYDYMYMPKRWYTWKCTETVSAFKQQRLQKKSLYLQML